MKRIEKSVTSQMEAAQAAAAEVARNQAESMQTAWAETWNQQLGRSGEIYGRLFAGMQDEVTHFVQKRLDANMETARAWGACRGVNEALELQQSWLRTAVEHYSSEGVRMSELCRSAFFAAEPETGHTPDEARAAHERRPSHEPQTHIQRAAE
jgi:hypothetical protein